MPGLCQYSWQTEASDWSAGCIWRSSDYIERATFVALALMLAYTAIVAIRFLRRYYLLHSELHDCSQDDVPAARRITSTFVTDFYPGIEMVRGIASAAPFLGLAGTCYRFLAGFYRISTGGSISSAIGAVAGFVVDAPIATLAGILVAIPAAIVYSSLSSDLETVRHRIPSSDTSDNDLRSFRIARTLPLRNRFSRLPAFPVIAAPVVACVIVGYMVLSPYPAALGLRIRLLPMQGLERGDHALEQLRISILASENDGPTIRVNSEKVTLDKLTDLTRRKLQGSGSREVFVEADAEIQWGYVADIVDRMSSLHCRVVLLTTSPAREVNRSPSRK